ncbi:MAG: tRNA pseudouridine(38-40) synthase TruA [Pseudomonadales bacterium]|nr:tRNA pseudouridine(38-40) synthase TruA [Pseudomonadales bacterium]
MELPEERRRIALGIEYHGTGYHGWQRQKRDPVPTVQEALERALSKIAASDVKTVCAGRTDAGVHATAQVVHFDTSVRREPKAWIYGVNTHLPDDISVRWVAETDDSFHARFSATARRYRYLIFNHSSKQALFHDTVTWCYRPLNLEKMQHAASYLEGEHDFTSFRAAACQAKSPVRNLEFVRVYRAGSLIVLDVKANAFLQHMVRNIAGVLIDIGSGKYEPKWAKEVLEARNRCDGAMTASANGLYLVAVDYPEKFQLPDNPLGPFLVADQPG